MTKDTPPFEPKVTIKHLPACCVTDIHASIEFHSNTAIADYALLPATHPYDLIDLSRRQALNALVHEIDRWLTKYAAINNITLKSHQEAYGRGFDYAQHRSLFQ